MGLCLSTRHHLRMLGLLLFMVGVLATRADERVEWQDLDQLCGQLQLQTPTTKTIVVDGRTESRLDTAYLEGASVSLYLSTSTRKECCAPRPMATTRSARHGAFQFTKIAPGYYWVRVQKNFLSRVIPIHVTNAFDERACNDASVVRSIVVDSIPPKVETRIR